MQQQDTDFVPYSSAQEQLQSILTRAVILTTRMAESLHFYRDILGQVVIEDRLIGNDIGLKFIDGGPDARFRIVVLRGDCEYPGYAAAGGRIGLIEIDDDAAPEVDVDTKTTRLARDGDVILVFQVKQLERIAEKIRDAGCRILFGPQLSVKRIARHMMVVDPNGHICELVELIFTPASRDAR